MCTYFIKNILEIHSSIMCSTPKLEATQMHILRRMDKAIVVNSHHTLLRSNEKTTMTWSKINGSHKNNCSSKTRRGPYCMIIRVWKTDKQAKLSHSVRSQDGGWGVTRKGTSGFHVIFCFLSCAVYTGVLSANSMSCTFTICALCCICYKNFEKDYLSKNLLDVKPSGSCWGLKLNWGLDS